MSENLKRYSTQTYALSSEEKDLLKVLATSEDSRPATLARCLYYRGLQAFLRDHTLCLDAEEQREFERGVHQQFESYVAASPDRDGMLQMLRKKRERRASKKMA